MNLDVPIGHSIWLVVIDDLSRDVGRDLFPEHHKRAIQPRIILVASNDMASESFFDYLAALNHTLNSGFGSLLDDILGLFPDVPWVKDCSALIRQKFPFIGLS
jgi:hypothetical protein